MVVPADRQRYLAEIAAGVRNYHKQVVVQANLARQQQQLAATKAMLLESGSDAPGTIDSLIAERKQAMDVTASKLARELARRGGSL